MFVYKERWFGAWGLLFRVPSQNNDKSVPDIISFDVSIFASVLHSILYTPYEPKRKSRLNFLRIFASSVVQIGLRIAKIRLIEKLQSETVTAP